MGWASPTAVEKSPSHDLRPLERPAAASADAAASAARAAAATAAAAAACGAAPDAFMDVPEGSYYEKAVDWANHRRHR